MPDEKKEIIYEKKEISSKISSLAPTDEIIKIYQEGIINDNDDNDNDND